MMCVRVGVSPHHRLCSEPQCISISQCENSHAKSCHCIPVPLHLSKSSLITMATRKMVHQETLPAFKGPKHKSGASILLTGVQKTQGVLVHRAPHRCLKRGEIEKGRTAERERESKLSRRNTECDGLMCGR